MPERPRVRLLRLQKWAEGAVATAMLFQIKVVVLSAG